MDGSVLPGNKTLTSTLVVSIRPPHPGKRQRQDKTAHHIKNIANFQVKTYSAL